MVAKEKEELKSYVSRVDSITKDLDVFLIVRSDKKLQDLLRRGIVGGGNLTMAIAVFAAFDYLAKIHWVLSGKNIDNKKFNEIIATTAFSDLVKKSKIRGALGITPRMSALVLWRAWRNHLVKALAPEHGNTAITITFARIPSTHWRRTARILFNISRNINASRHKSFIKKGGIIQCFIDILYKRDLEAAKNYILKSIDNDKYTQKNLKDALVTLKRFLGDPAN